MRELPLSSPQHCTDYVDTLSVMKQFFQLESHQTAIICVTIYKETSILLSLLLYQGKDGRDGKDFTSLTLLRGVINETVAKGE